MSGKDGGCHVQETHFDHLYRMDESRLKKRSISFYERKINGWEEQPKTWRKQELESRSFWTGSSIGKAIRVLGFFKKRIQEEDRYFMKSEEKQRVRMKKYWEDVKSAVRMRKNKTKLDCYTWSIVGPCEKK